MSTFQSQLKRLIKERRSFKTTKVRVGSTIDKSMLWRAIH